MNKTVVIDESLCTACGTCVAMCPKKILYIDEADNVCRVTDETKCDRLGGCERKCTAGAIKIN
ncbi:MAG: 4Fe-4S binding protein [Dehalococcoidia bacterium]|jgi:2-oxoglutarate ferredoxin oxidoreductase subunit delta